MSPSGNTRPPLALADPPQIPDNPLARAEVARANLLASGMSPLDARWIMAMKVSAALEGGRAAILTPDRRQSLLGNARRLGFRDFDANLLIALVQDARRSGKGGLNPDVESRLTAFASPVAPAITPNWPALLAAVVLALGIGLGLMLWVSTGP